MLFKIELTIEYDTKDFDFHFTGIGGLLVVGCRSNLASLLQVVNTVALGSPADSLSFPDSSQSFNFQPVGECGIFAMQDLLLSCTRSVILHQEREEGC